MFREFLSDRNGNPESPVPPATAPVVDFELLDLASGCGAIDIAQVSDWVELSLQVG